jgi:putative hydrolase of the HAD superfamily
MLAKAVLFDLFDTLLLIDDGDDDEEVYYMPCLRRTYEFLVKNGINVAFEEFRRVYFEVRDKSYSETQKTHEEPHFNVRISTTLQKLGYKFDVSDTVVAGATWAFAEEFMHYVHIDREAISVLRELRSKYKLGIVSNFAIPECVWKLLDNFGLRKFFDAVLISGEVNKRKPSPEVFDIALKALGVHPSEAVFVGDMPVFDVKGPKSVGMKAVLIERKRMKGIDDAAPDRVIKNLRELPSVIETI